jgi:hypothetical protein
MSVENACILSILDLHISIISKWYHHVHQESS